MARSVISVGDDPELLSLRHAVLERAGYAVHTASDPHSASEKITADGCDALLLCYSLPLNVRQRLATQFRSRCPDGRIIAISNQPTQPPIDADAFLYGIEGPETLLDIVRTQVGEPTPPAQGA